jgi:hypothetical protein
MLRFCFWEEEAGEASSRLARRGAQPANSRKTLTEARLADGAAWVIRGRRRRFRGGQRAKRAAAKRCNPKLRQMPLNPSIAD